MNIEEIINGNFPASQKIAKLKEKSIYVPKWGGADGLVSEYDPRDHPVMNKALYPDITDNKGNVERVTRITYNWQQLAAKRMTELCCGIPIKRVYNYDSEDEKQKVVAGWIERIFKRSRIDSMNIERLNMLFAGCEVMTLWYAVESNSNIYGFNSATRLRCRNFSPMLGDQLYPLWDEMGDMIALSVGYTRKVGGSEVSFFDAYTNTRHIKFSNESGDFVMVEDEPITIMKIPAVYMWRPTPIWEDASRIVFETEWAMSRNGNYLRRNSKPLFIVCADEQINYGDEKDNESRSVLQYPAGASANYVTWTQAVENLRFHITELRNSFFTQLQLPDWSYEKMSQQAMSGESRKQLFVDSQLKVKDESGRVMEFMEREVNVVKAFLKTMVSAEYHEAIDALMVEIEITPFSITDDKDTITNLMQANGGKPIMSQRESIALLGWSPDVDRTIEEIGNETQKDVFMGYE